MKIHPGLHDLTVADSIDRENDVQLAYISDKEYTQKVSLSSDYTISEFKPVAPYTVFDIGSPFDIYLFDNKKNLLDADTRTNILIRTDDDKFMYIPSGGITFRPQEFTYKLVGKRTAKYNSSRDYNITVRCLNEYNDPDNSSEYGLSSQLIKIFGDAPSRQICPNNVWVNNGDISVNSLYVTGNESYIDFGFIKSQDGKTYNIYDEQNQLIDNQPILDNTLLEKFLALWIVVDDENFITEDETKTLHNVVSQYDYVIENRNLYSNISLDSELKLVSKNELEDTDITLSRSSFSPVVIRHDEVNQRYIIYSPASFIENINNNASLLYEILIKVYLMGYVKTEDKNMWITDTIPDYILVNHQLVTKSQFVSHDTYYVALGLNKNEVTLVDTIASAPNIIIAGLTADDRIIFIKDYSGPNAVYKDPDKPSGFISIYCHNKTIMYYQNLVYMIKTNINDVLTYDLHDNKLNIALENFIDSDGAIYIPHFSDNYTIEKDINSNILLVVKNNIVTLKKQEEYTESDGIILCTFYIYTSVNDSYVINDIRLRGGGLPDNVKHDVQSLFDIGTIEGMSYRAGGSIVIKIPAALEGYKDLIMNAVKKHIAADEYPFIILY